MGIITLAILLFVIIIFFQIVKKLCKKFNVSKKIIIITFVILITIGIVIILFIKFNVFNKIPCEKYENRENVITKEEKEKAIAIVQYRRYIASDSESLETYYIYKDENSEYYYYKTSDTITISGSQGETINERGNINNRNKLEEIIKNFEQKAATSNYSKNYVTIRYNGTEIEKEELLNKLFD